MGIDRNDREGRKVFAAIPNEVRKPYSNEAVYLEIWKVSREWRSFSR